MERQRSKKLKTVNSFFTSFVQKKSKGECSATIPTTTVEGDTDSTTPNIDLDPKENLSLANEPVVTPASMEPEIVNATNIEPSMEPEIVNATNIDQSMEPEIVTELNLRVPFAFEPRIPFDENKLERDPGLRMPILRLKSYHQDEARRAYIKWKPFQPILREYPWIEDSSGQLRRFSKGWFEKFTWLEYSPTNDRAYCHPCFIFEHQTHLQRVFTTGGYNDWKRVNNGKKCPFLSHVGGPNSNHRKAVLHAAALMNTSRHIDKVIGNLGSEEIKKNHLRIKSSIEAIRWLTKQGCALRGHDESVTSTNRGNFIELLSYMGTFNIDINDVILENAPGNAKYVASSIQKDLLHIYGNKVRRKIRAEIGNNKFCILVDKAKDIANREQMAIVLRFVDEDGFLQERFFEIVYVKDTCAETLKKEISYVLARYDLDIMNMRGQGYDGASNMSGINKGLQALFKEDCLCAYYVHCFAHRLQLAVVATAEQNFCIWLFFSKLTLIVNLMNESPKWNTELQRLQAIIIAEEISSGERETGIGANQRGTLQRAVVTCWSSNFDAIV